MKNEFLTIILVSLIFSVYSDNSVGLKGTSCNSADVKLENLFALTNLSNKKAGIFIERGNYYTIDYSDDTNCKNYIDKGQTSITSSKKIFKILDISEEKKIILGGIHFLYFIDENNQLLGQFNSNVQVSDLVTTSIQVNENKNKLLIAYGTSDAGKTKIYVKKISVDLASNGLTEEKSFSFDISSTVSNKDIITCLFFDNNEKVVCSYIENNRVITRFLNEDWTDLEEEVSRDSDDTAQEVKGVRLSEEKTCFGFFGGSKIKTDCLILWNGETEYIDTLYEFSPTGTNDFDFFLNKRDDNSFLIVQGDHFDDGFLGGINLQFTFISYFGPSDFVHVQSTFTFTAADEHLFVFTSSSELLHFKREGTGTYSFIEFFFPECKDHEVFLRSGEEITLETSSLTTTNPNEVAVELSEVVDGVIVLSAVPSGDSSNQLKITAGNSGEGKVYFDFSATTTSVGKVTSRGCKVDVHVCNSLCSKCSEYSNNAEDPKCISCIDQYYPTEDQPSRCFKEDEVTGYYLSNKILKKCFGSCSTCKGVGTSDNHNCRTCKTDYTLKQNKCVCEDSFYFYSNGDYDICVSSCPNDHPYLNQGSKECLANCQTGKKIYKNTCLDECPENSKLNEDGVNCEEEEISTITDVISKVDNKILDLYKNNPTSSFGDSSYKIYTTTETPTFSSRVSLGNQCQTEIKEANEIPEPDSLLIFQADFERKNQISKQVEYSVYSMKGKRLSTDPCKASGSKVMITIPLNFDANPNINLTFAKEMADLGYDIFDPNDSFYTDICTPYTSEDGTDMTLEDRKKDIYQNISFCEEGCDYGGVDLDTREVLCICEAKNGVSEEESTFSFNKLGSEFTSITKQANIKIVKCYNMVFNAKRLIHNYGSFLMFGLILVSEVMLLVYIKVGMTPILSVIHRFLHKKNVEQAKKEEKEISEESVNDDQEIGRGGNKGPYDLSGGRLTSNPPPKSSQKLKQVGVFCVGEDSSPTKKKRVSVVEVRLSNQNQNKNYTSSSTMKTSKFMRSSSSKSNTLYGLEEEKGVKKVSSLESLNEKANFEDNKEYTNEELDEMEFEEAVEKDKRNYFKQFWSQMRYKQSIIFTFFVSSDFNLKSLKIALYVLGISMMIGFNALFYTDDTISRNYETGGKFEFVYSLPKTIIVNIICDVIMFVIEFLSLSQDKVQEIKEIEDKEEAEQFSHKFVKCWKIKIVVFFILTTLLNLFIWYYIAAFCSVYKNTQKHLLKDCLMSFVEEIIFSLIFIFFIVSFRMIGLYFKLKWIFCVSSSIEKLHIFF